MSNFVGITSTTVDTLNDKGDRCSMVITSILTTNGQVLTKDAFHDEWFETRAPDLRGEIIGVCRDCGRAIYEEDEWNFSTQDKGWTAHALEEDCKK